MPSANPQADIPTPERLVEGLGPLPPVAHMLARLQQLLADANSGLDDISDLIRLDAALATRIIQISNSAWFAGGAQCRTIFDAVSRVGFREVYHLVSVVASNSVVARRLTAYGRDAITMWRESVACAFASEILADRLGEDTAAAYMSGLLHAIGRIAINQHLVAGPAAGKPLVDDGFPQDFSGAEFALLGFNQADVSAVMLKKWDFTDAIIEPIRRQYDPLEAPEPHDRMGAILYGARFLRTVACHSPRLGEIADEEEILGSLRMTREEVLSYLPQLRENMTRALRMTNL